ncbi:unnamed protein product [Rotaria sp. Silwood1]|nr:unnamed protein product [Rotaria sp. Silwood1]CAF4848881.1 unnamed protein product [Rotaria sp. Silwood1]
MVSFENLRPLLTNPLAPEQSCTELQDDVLSSLTTIVMVPNSIPTVSSIKNKDELSELLIKNRKLTSNNSMADVSRRLRRRKIIYDRLCKINDIMCFLGLLGVLLMIIENEIKFMSLNEKGIMISWIIKLIITITTIILVGLVFYYHCLDLKLYSVNNAMNNWCISLTNTKKISILFEVFICFIHPFPRSFPLNSNLRHDNATITDSLKTTPMSPSHINIDVPLGLLMFARFYLVFRFILFHSFLFRDASAQSLGYLNKVSMDIFFLIKIYLEQWPTRCLLSFCGLLFFIGSWSLRACNYITIAEHLSILDSMWLLIVTFTTIGYGDITPSTYCGRCIASIIGLIGVLSTALLISVLADKLKLTRSEKYVHNFVLNIELAKKRNNQAANIIKFVIKVWYLKRKHQCTSAEYIRVQQKLFRSIRFIQKLKQKQGKLIDNCIGLQEIIMIQRETNSKTEENAEQLTIMKSKVDKIDENLVDINHTMISIEKTLNLLLNKISQEEKTF